MTIPAGPRVVASVLVFWIADIVFHLRFHGAVKNLGGKSLEDTLAKHIVLRQPHEYRSGPQKIDRLFLLSVSF